MKRLIATALATAMALTSVSATPVRAADSGEIGRFLLGAGTLFIIGSALSNSNKHRYQNRRYYDGDGHVTRRYDKPRHKIKPRRKVVPSACLRFNKWDNGPRRFFGRHCLRKNMHHAGRLPGQCQRTIWTHRGQRTVYAARCLRRNGWVFG